tara:strand:+ start:952 stop:1530 length:579 start_codon:yes stop_codon:yes gene_type:complete
MTENLIRTFLCIPVSKEIKSKKMMLFSTIDGSKSTIKWVKNSNLHLSIKFVGQTPESSLKEIIHNVASITSKIKPFNLEISGTGCFPIQNRPRTLWMGIIGNINPLKELVLDIENKLSKIGFSKDKKIFIPHITIARINYPQKITPDIDLFLKSSYDVIDLEVDRLQFFSSELYSNGAIYSLLKTFPIGETI